MLNKEGFASSRADIQRGRCRMRARSPGASFRISYGPSRARSAAPWGPAHQSTEFGQRDQILKLPRRARVKRGACETKL
eukprot:8885462-Pyramimonas_sp.AAC.1